ncbi:MAG: hypothetical protein HQL51_07535 [Magnetococcales bacterium]|nr:hypothetical protein [Magnetococcales bacterium]
MEVESPLSSGDPTADYSGSGRTVFLLLDSGTSIRNILRTDVFARLRAEPETRLVVFVPPPALTAAFRREFAGPGVVLEPLISQPPTARGKFWRSLRRDLWAATAGVDSYRGIRARNWIFPPRAGLLKLWASRIAGGAAALLERFWQKERAAFPLADHPLFHRYRPEVIFCGTLYPKDPCLELIAPRLGVPVVALVHSWDNLTTKGPFPFQPDRWIVWNDLLKGELERLHGVDPARIFVSGMPQSDLYVRREGYWSREKFFAHHQLDPARRLIVYTSGPPGLVPMDPAIAEILAGMVAANRWSDPCQLLVRLHPKDDPGRYAGLRGRPGVTVQLPGEKAATNDGWNPSEREMHQLAETLCYADVVVNIASTITIDACAFDTPVVNVAFDGPRDLPPGRSCRRFYAFDHYRSIVATGGARMAFSAEELQRALAAYLADPSLDAEGRERIRREQYGVLDGQAGRRVAECILGGLGAATNEGERETRP